MAETWAVLQYKGLEWPEIDEAMRVNGYNVVSCDRRGIRPNDDTIKALEQADGAIIRQRVFGDQQAFRQVLADRGDSIKLMFCDFSPLLPHYRTLIFDPKGENGASALCRGWHRLSGDGDIPGVAPPAQPPSWCRLVPRPFVFLAMQRPHDNTIRLDARHMTHRDTFNRVHEAARRVGCFLVAKTHPSDVRVRLDRPDIGEDYFVIRERFSAVGEEINEWLLANARYVVAVNSSMLTRAAMHRKAAVSLGWGYFTGANVVNEQDFDSINLQAAVPPTNTALRKYFGVLRDRSARKEHLAERLPAIIEQMPFEPFRLDDHPPKRGGGSAWPGRQ